MTTICLDFGNTRCKAAIFNGDEIVETMVFGNDLPGEARSLIDRFQPSRSVLSSVIDHDLAVEEVLAERTSFFKLDHQAKLPFTIPVGKPETVGADRLAIVAAAVHLFPGKNNLAIGMGSCITYNFINQQHEFMGGAISPGMDMRFRAMHEYTAKLPLVKADWNVPLVGYDTRTNLQTGVVMGIAKEIDGMVEAYMEKYGNFNVLLTGGDLVIFEPHLKNKIFADPHLIFKGLYAISQINAA
jgi:type III pantothenate kinase